MTTLLPANSTALERAIESVANRDVSVPIRALWDVEACPDEWLPWLAWAMHVDGLDEIADADEKREAIRQSAALHRKKGTPWAVKNALAVHRYQDCSLIEHRQLLDEWLAAGGELLDGIGIIDGDGDLSAPGGYFRFMTTHWAEYALRLNASDGATTTDMLRRIAALCAQYAPVRAHLIGILLFARLVFDARPRVGALRGAMHHTMRHCRRIAVPRFDTLDGCDLIGGETLEDFIDGDGTLDGNGILNAELTIGEPLDAGQLDIRLPRARARIHAAALGGPRAEPPEFLDSIDALDGRSLIAGECIDGYGRLDSGDLYYPTLADGDDTLDGSSNLGEVAGPYNIWLNLRASFRRGTTIYEE
jgi:hypothetical protein